MPTFLKNMRISFISLVRKGANKREIIFKSGDGDPPISFDVPIVKIDVDGRRFFSIVYAPNEEDSQGEFTTAEEIQKAAYDFMKNLRLLNVDRSHSYQAEKAFVAESWLLRKGDPIFPKDPEGSWAVGIIVEDDDLWKEVKDGEINAISMGGTGDRVKDVEIQKVWEETENEIRYKVRDEGLFQRESFRYHKISDEKGGISLVIGRLKGQTTTTTQALRFVRKTDEHAGWTLSEAKKWWEDHKDEFVRKSWDDIYDDLPAADSLLLQIDDESVLNKLAKRLGKIFFGDDFTMEGGETDMKKEEVQAMIDAALEPINKKIEELPKPLTKEGILEAFKEGVKPVVERVEKLEKKTKGSTQDDDDLKKEADLENIGSEMAKIVNE